MFRVVSGTFAGKFVFCFTLPGLLLGVYILLKARKHSLLNAAKERQTELVAELDEYYKAYGYCPVSIEYTHPQLLNQIHSMIHQGRATTIDAAINVMYDDLHRSTTSYWL
jgi:hypothetical protein